MIITSHVSCNEHIIFDSTCTSITRIEFTGSTMDKTMYDVGCIIHDSLYNVCKANRINHAIRINLIDSLDFGEIVNLK